MGPLNKTSTEQNKLPKTSIPTMKNPNRDHGYSTSISMNVWYTVTRVKYTPDTK
jgi:hypothetical protein